MDFLVSSVITCFLIFVRLRVLLITSFIFSFTLNSPQGIKSRMLSYVTCIHTMDFCMKYLFLSLLVEKRAKFTKGWWFVVQCGCDTKS